MSGKWVSNPRPAAWEAAALPTELLPLVVAKLQPVFCIVKRISLKSQYRTLDYIAGLVHLLFGDDQRGRKPDLVAMSRLG